MLEPTVLWGDNAGITWENATDEVKEEFALQRLFWYHRMVMSGGPDGSELDAEVVQQAEEAAEWFWPRLEARAKEAR